MLHESSAALHDMAAAHGCLSGGTYWSSTNRTVEDAARASVARSTETAATKECVQSYQCRTGAHEVREQCRGDAAAGADVEHFVARLHLQALDHARVHVCTCMARQR